VTDGTHRANAGKIRELMSAYARAEDLVNIGAYRSGANATIDRALAQIDPINRLLKQGVEDKIKPELAVNEMQKIITAGGGL